MKIQILGTGCAKCKLLAGNAEAAIQAAESDAEIVKITDLDEIMEFGVMLTPALAIDGKVLSTGKVLSKDEIIALINKEG